MIFFVFFLVSVVSLVSVDSYLDWLDLNCKLCFWPAPFLPLAELLSICHIYMHGPLMVETWADRIWGYLLCLVPFKDFSILFSGHVSSDFSFLFPQARKPEYYIPLLLVCCTLPKAESCENGNPVCITPLLQVCAFHWSLSASLLLSSAFT